MDVAPKIRSAELSRRSILQNLAFTAGGAAMLGTSGRLASYRINQQSGALTPVALEEVGHRPAAVLATRIG